MVNMLLYIYIVVRHIFSNVIYLRAIYSQQRAAHPLVWGLNAFASTPTN